MDQTRCCFSHTIVIDGVARKRSFMVLLFLRCDVAGRMANDFGNNTIIRNHTESMEDNGSHFSLLLNFLKMKHNHSPHEQEEPCRFLGYTSKERCKRNVAGAFCSFQFSALPTDLNGQARRTQCKQCASLLLVYQAAEDCDVTIAFCSLDFLRRWKIHSLLAGRG